MADTKLLNVAEAADLLRLSPRTLEAWARGPHPRIPAVRLGRRLLFDRTALEDWLQSHTVTPRDVAQR